MILNYLKLAFRLLLRKPFFSFLNIVGLAVGFAVFLILWQYSESELSSDTQWKDHERIARLGFFWEWTDDGKNWEGNKGGTTSTEMAVKFVERYPEVESVTRIIRQPQFGIEPRYTGGLASRINVSVPLPSGDRRLFQEDNLACADANLFEFFGIPFISGNQSTALSLANSVVVNQSVAEKYFGEEEAVGKIILINNNSFLVTGVFQDLPSSTHLNFDIVVSNTAHVSFWATESLGPLCFAYLKSKTILDWSDLEDKINEPETLKKDWALAIKSFPNARGRSLLQPLRDVVFSDWLGFVSQHISKSKPLLMAFRLIGVLVLALAIINYITLNASHVANRLKEIATRKVSGARSRDFFGQFAVETSLVFLLSIGLALTFVQLFRTPVTMWLQIPVQQITGQTSLVFGVVSLVSILICTSYPVYASKIYHPRVLLIKSSTPKKRRLVSLAAVQYSIAIMLLLSSMIIYRQITFLLHKNLGFNKEQVVIIDSPVVRTANYERDMEVLHSRISSNKGVRLATICTTIMGDEPNLMTVKKPGVDYPVVLDANGGVDENFIPFYDLSLLAGRNFNRDEKGAVIIVSDGALLRLGFPDPASAVGNHIWVLSDAVLGRRDEWVDVEIIGVVKGYRLRPYIKFGNEYDKEDRGMGFTYKTNLIASYQPEKITVRLFEGNFGETLAEIKREFEQLFPGNLFRWYFLDDNINQHYQNEKTRRNQILVFTCLAIGIACLGLLGMISNKVVEKTKEIGIRKVMGAKLSHIASLILQSTVKQLVAAVVISIPIAWYVTDQYLQNFTERIEQQWWHYALPVVLLIGIMLCTIASVLWKAATTNPVESLRYE
jgi:putative ABC transport system permease protein